jgi:hypothetical protein
MDDVTRGGVIPGAGNATGESTRELRHHLVQTAVAHAGYQLVD